MRHLLAAAVAFALIVPARAEDVRPQPDAATSVKSALAALEKSQQADGHWGKTFPVAVTSISALALFNGAEKPFDNAAMWKAYDWLLANQIAGKWKVEGHTWLHSQGFATLFMAELYGAVLMAKDKPAKVDLEKLKALVTEAAGHVARAQSDTGGWFYHDAAGTHEHEGSTTVCAVQALAAARNFGIPVSKEVLAKGFAYLKETQRPDGGFEYQKGSGSSMVAGTSGALATLVLMQKLDEKVLMNAMDYLAKIKVAGLSADRFPDYALFYTAMGMAVIDEEYGKHKPEAAAWLPEISAHVIKLQREDGTWANTGWMTDQESDPAYATGFYALTLSGPKGRLSLFHRDAPELPE